MDVWTIVSAALGLVAVVASGFWLKAKGKIAAIGTLVKEAYEVIATVHEILQDDKVDKAEIEELKKEAADVANAFKALIGK
jgi:Tfp pilus assembly protein PilO